MFVRYISRSLSRPFIGNISLRNKGSGVLIETFQANKGNAQSTLHQNQPTGEIIQGHRFCSQCHRVQFQLNELNQFSRLKRGIHNHISHNHTRHKISIFSLKRLKLLGKSAIAITVFSFGAYYFSRTLHIPSLSDAVVHADSRNKNNFIADVVEKAGPAVVFLEIKGR